jgi:2-polyprenyl-6-methoxyphenol hydroxylase-like FAD-dependent oxidoreductase
MKKLTSAPTILTVHHYKNLLAAEGIASEVRNVHFGALLGEMPFTDTWPQLWVVNDLDYDRAQQLISGAAMDESPSEAWQCPNCGESNEGQFAACWNCGAAES